ncbi:GroES-like protein [Mytilinidion resinicola]|uniref:GroES-like protein n=1 Tax=Mytilinidion resinicola TaxID=574789 RepID=A0A6A6Z8P2_9PEZI|nr:GroES-like protein [Mytilinidion resinicola]KAF2816577.1 GroES-like protein [Mytilinidion resinicola]
MKEAIVAPDQTVEIVDSPIPIPQPGQVLIKVIFSGSHDIAGIVHALGAGVYQFKVGDRVAAFHEMFTPGASFAEYALAWQCTTFHLPDHVSFAEAATLPLAGMTAAVGLYRYLGLPEPWSSATPKDSEKRPILVYGAASAVGAFAVQLARLSGLHPIMGVAGRGVAFAEGLIDKSKGDAIIDYRGGEKAVIAGIKDALQAAGCDHVPLQYCFDAIAEAGTHEIIAAVLDTKLGSSKATHVMPIERFATKGFKYPKGIEASLMMVGDVHGPAKDFGYIWLQYFSRLLEDGRLKPHPFEEKPGGLGGIAAALRDLKEGKASAVKYVFDIGRTEGVERA